MLTLKDLIVPITSDATVEVGDPIRDYNVVTRRITLMGIWNTRDRIT